MELYIEKEFLDDFYIDFGGTRIQNIVKNIITNYGDKRVFVNYDIDKFEQLKSENEFFALIGSTAVPIPVDDVFESLKRADFSQTLVFTKNENQWFNEIENKGALCFSFSNYEEKIKYIIDSLHFKIDLSEPLGGWGFLKQFREINFNKIVVTDGYILANKTNQKTDQNIIPILKELTKNKESQVEVSFFTKDLSPISNQPKHIKEKAKKTIRNLNSTLTNCKMKFKIVSTSFDSRSRIDFHDRNIATNFSILDSGKGFNLIPHKVANSQIISETIFDKYTYNRLNNIFRLQKKYIENLKTLETLEFKQYP